MTIRIRPEVSVTNREGPLGNSTEVRVRVPETNVAMRVPESMMMGNIDSSVLGQNLQTAVNNLTAESNNRLANSLDQVLYEAVNLSAAPAVSAASDTNTRPLTGAVNVDWNRPMPDDFYYNSIRDNYFSFQSNRDPYIRNVRMNPTRNTDMDGYDRTAAAIGSDIGFTEDRVKAYIKKYIAEELELKVETEKVNNRLEIKVSLVDVASGKEVLSDSDYIEVDDE